MPLADGTAMYFGGSIMTFALPYGAFIVIAVALYFLFRAKHSGPKLKYGTTAPIASFTTREPGPVPAPPSLPPLRKRAEVRAELGIRDREQDGEVLVLAVGRLAPQKDYPTLLRAASAWKDSAIRLVVAGDGPLRASAQDRINAEGLPVDLLGHRSDVADLLAAADVFVLASTWEARALVVQEAMRAAVPVVATSVGGIPGLVGDAAVLVPAGDAEAVARAVSRLARDAGERASLAAAGRARAATWPDLDQCATDLIELYEGLIAER